MELEPAQEMELKILALQKPMNEIIERGDSSVQQFYRDATVFLTGGSGFIGKQLIEKLFRSCAIKKLYMLLRPSRGKTIQERLTSILKDPVYDQLRSKQPGFADKIFVMEGDVAELKLGLSEENWTTLTEEVDIIFHVAATVRFNEPLKMATLINLRGTREAVALGKECKHLKCFNHTSTAFAHATESRIENDVEEKFYPSPVPPEALISMVETVDEDKLNALTPNLIADWPNTYTFTKALAEELIRRAAGDMPVCIVKPPVVTSAYIEPAPGWIDMKTCFSSILGALLGAGLGLFHVLLSKQDNPISFAPVDYVNNAIIAASWDAAERRKMGDPEIPIYTVSSSRCGTNWKFLGDTLRTDELLKLVSPKAMWYTSLIECSNDYVYWVLTWLFHYIPGYAIDAIIDVLGVRPKGLPKLVKIYSKAYSISQVYRYFSFNYWIFKDDNLRSMIQRMSPADKVIYNCDVTNIDYTDLIKTWCVGLRRFIIKDNLVGSAASYNRQKYLLKYANYTALALYFYLIYYVLATILSLFVTIVGYFI
ncbi:fatty acyl-CoA reductase wat-like isoform X2 [Anticarsia gemmatalis]|uniref:fatty acyl-CoA reductase wat-like isoform X2 n=1 Tax=Anticarsia gemmatalis TaxID=129554 RepID=UPI003F7699E8